MKSSKGSRFEREICKLLSEWWTKDTATPRDDVFWRSSNSGARATIRSKRGKGTAGQDGDICATDPIGNTLIKLLTLELKRGYSAESVQDFLDSPLGSKPKKFEQFLQQTIRSYLNSGSFSWALIFKRDRRDPWIWTPQYCYLLLKDVGAFHPDRAPDSIVHVTHKIRNVPPSESEFIGMPLMAFLHGCDRTHFIKLKKELAK